MTHLVHVTRPAEDDVRATLRYLAARSRPGAHAWRRAFEAMLKRLEHRPEGYALAPEDDLFDEPVRQTLFKTRAGRPHRAVFVVRATTVYVLRVRGPGQNLLDADEVDLP